MKRIALVFFLGILFFALPVSALDYLGALKAAKQENKPVLLYFFSNSCVYCKVMDKDTLADKEIVSILRKDFVFLRIETEKAPDLMMYYEIRGTPSSWFLEPSGKPIRQIPGYIPKDEYKILLEYFKSGRYKDTDIQTYFKKASGKK